MSFEHDCANDVRFTIEIEDGGQKNVMVIETELVVSPLMSGYDEVMVPDLTEAALQYLEDNKADLDRVTILSLPKKNI